MATGPRTYRYQLALCTGNDDSEYYDQTTALSQALINRSFRHLFENTEGVARIDYFDDVVGDRIFGVIKEANVVFRNGQTLTLSQWALTVKVNLSEVSLEIQPSDDEETRRNKDYWKQDIVRRYPGLEVGDYRAQRIFANFSAAQWKNPVEERSTCFDQKAKKTIALQEWKDQPENSSYFYRIMDLIGGWAKTQAHEGLSTLGIKFSLYQDPEPMLQHIQVYPYKSRKCPNETTTIGNPSKITPAAPFGDLVHGDFNCLMFCENVDTSWNVPGKCTNPMFRFLSQKKHMSHSYNMACPISDDDPKLPDLLGTFAMDYRVVMHRYLLPALEDLCLAIVVKIEEPE
ncbi:hypothetical protein FCOIX_42, partial [Fusarium coicis]